jgi:hypothetical protein
LPTGATTISISAPSPAVGITPPSRIGRLDAPVNTDDGKMYGAEVAATLPLNVITDALDGFGLTGGPWLHQDPRARLPG